MESKQRYSGAMLSVLWTVQFILLPLHILAVAFVVMEYEADLGWVPGVYIGELCLFSICFLIMPIEISGYLFNFLNPWWFLTSQIFRLFFYGIVAGFDIYQSTITPANILSSFWNIWRWVNLALAMLLFIAFGVQLVYAGIVLHRYRKVGAQYNKVDFVEDTQYSPRRVRSEHESHPRPMMTV